MNGEDIDGSPISSNRTRRHRLFARTGGHERLLEQKKRIVDAYLGESRFVLPDHFRKNRDVYQ